MRHKLISSLALLMTLTLLMRFASAEDAQREYSYILNNGVHVTVIEEPFNPSRHKITHCYEKSDSDEITDQSFICKIDGLSFYGVGEAPEPSTELKTIIVTIDGRLYRLNTSQMYNAWGDFRLPDDYLWVTCHKQSCSVKGLFSDATGAFAAEWKIQNGKSKRVLITGDEAIVFQFIDEIDTKKHITHHSSGTR